MKKNIVIVVIAFNRAKSLKRLLNSLDKLIVNEEEKITLYISIDRSKQEDIRNQEVFECAQNFNWKFGEKIINYRNKNMGLRKHILDCGNLTNIYENIIVLEDDVVVSPLMYIYAKQAINFYKNDEDNIAGFSLYSYQRNQINNLPFYPINNGSDICFIKYACSWGQIWTKNRWKDFYAWYEKNVNTDFSSYKSIPKYILNWGENSWLKFHTIYCILNNKYFVYPQIGLTSNFTDYGTHNKVPSIAYQCDICFNNNLNVNFKFDEFSKAYNIYDAYFENEKLKELINHKDKIVSDFYGKKSIEYLKQQGRYILSTQELKYKKINNYSLQMYPYEMNVINEINGSDMFLYDMTIPMKSKIKRKEFTLLKYSYKLDLLSKKDIAIIIKGFLKDLKNRFINKMRRKRRNAK